MRAREVYEYNPLIRGARGISMGRTGHETTSMKRMRRDRAVGGTASILLIVCERVENGASWCGSRVSGSEAEMAVRSRENLLATWDGNILELGKLYTQRPNEVGHLRAIHFQ